MTPAKDAKAGRLRSVIATTQSKVRDEAPQVGGMIGPDTDALEALRSRLRHTEAIARLIASGAADRDIAGAFEGISAALEEQGERLDTIIADAVGKAAT